MATEAAIAALSSLARPSNGVFRGRDAVALGVSRQRLGALVRAGAATRLLPDTYALTAVAPSNAQRLRAALLWAGPDAAGSGRSAGEVFGFEGVRGDVPEIVTPWRSHLRASGVDVVRSRNLKAEMLRSHRGFRVTGPEATLARLAHLLDDEPFEIACEDARRRRLTSMPALRSYLDRYGRSGRLGTGALRALLDALDPVHPSRSTLEVKARRLLVSHGITDFVREFPLEWNGRTYFFDFAFPRWRTILETNGRRWHDDPDDYEDGNEKWSVPGRYGYKVVFATWGKVTRHSGEMLWELRTALAA